MGEGPVLGERWKQASLELIKSNPEFGFIAPLLHKHLESNGFEVEPKDVANFLSFLKARGHVRSVGKRKVSYGVGKKPNLTVYVHSSSGFEDTGEKRFKGDLFASDFLTRLRGSRPLERSGKRSSRQEIVKLIKDNPGVGFIQSVISEKLGIDKGRVLGILGKSSGDGINRVGFVKVSGHDKGSDYKVLVFQHKTGGLPHLSSESAYEKEFEGELFKV